MGWLDNAFENIKSASDEIGAIQDNVNEFFQGALESPLVKFAAQQTNNLTVAQKDAGMRPQVGAIQPPQSPAPAAPVSMAPSIMPNMTGGNSMVPIIVMAAVAAYFIFKKA